MILTKSNIKIKIMKKKLLLIAITLGIFSLNVQAQYKFGWAVSMGDTNGDFGRSITTDSSGNVYVTGWFEGTVDFDPGAETTDLTSAGGEDIFVLKLDASGKFLWAKAIGGISNDVGASITTDASGNVYVMGLFEEIVDFDPGGETTDLESAGGTDIFVLKLDASGNFLWAKSIGGTSFDYGYSITTDASENVYVTGSFGDTVDFDPGAGEMNLASAGSHDIFVLKLDATGNFLWAKSMGGTFDDRGCSITTDASGNVYVTGWFRETVEFDPGGTANLTSAGYFDIFVLKLDDSGNFLWAKTMGGTSNDSGYSITTDASENVYVTGSFLGTVAFDPGGTANLTSVGVADIFVLKLDDSGNFLWAKAMGGTSNDVGYSITTDASGNVYVTGMFGDTVDFDPGAGEMNLTSAGSGDIFVLKLDASGNFLWVKTMGGTSNDIGYSITTDALGNSYMTGRFSGMADFDPGAEIMNLTSAGSYDIFVEKLLYCSPLVADVIITPIDNTVSQTDITLTATAGSYTYQWVDCNNGNAPISGESNQGFTPDTDGSYAVEVSNGTCTVTSDCIDMIVLGITDELSDLGISVYPNPITDRLIIDKGENREIQIEILDNSGKLIISKTAKRKITSIDLSGYTPGVYFINLTNDEIRTVKRIIVK